MKTIAVALVFLTLAGCGEKEISRMDQCLRREIFKECLVNVPKGSMSVMSSDWDEVVDSCGQQAQYLSYRKLEQIKVECRP